MYKRFRCLCNIVSNDFNKGRYLRTNVNPFVIPSLLIINLCLNLNLSTSVLIRLSEYPCFKNQYVISLLCLIKSLSLEKILPSRNVLPGIRALWEGNFSVFVINRLFNLCGKNVYRTNFTNLFARKIFDQSLVQTLRILKKKFFFA